MLVLFLKRFDKSVLEFYPLCSGRGALGREPLAVSLVTFRVLQEDLSGGPGSGRDKWYQSISTAGRNLVEWPLVWSLKTYFV